MEVLCPSCQRKLTIPDHFAGQMAKCPMCNSTFTAPELPTTPGAAFVPAPSQPTLTIPTLGAGLPSVPLVPVLTPTPVITPAPASPLRGADQPAVPPAQVSAPLPADGFAIAPPPPADIPPVEGGAPRPVVPRGEAAAQAAPGEYAHRRSVHVNPRVLRWVVVIAVLVVFVLSFFPWVGRYPGGVPVATQSAWQVAFGSESIDKDVKLTATLRSEKDTKTESSVGASGLMIFYVLLLVLLVLLVPAVVIWELLSVKLPAALERLRPWRWGIVAGLTALALLLLVIQQVSGFNLEGRVTAAVDKASEEEQKAATESGSTSVDRKRLEIERGIRLGQLHRTAALGWATGLSVLAVLCALLVCWAERRGSRPLPRVDVLW